MAKPLVSVMMPAYNAAEFLPAAILSMQEQTYKDWELIVVDDGSTDDTYDLALIRSFDDDRIRVIESPHAGCPTARNIAVEASNGELIARLDADDVHSKDRLEKQVEFLLSEPKLDIVTCGYSWLKGGLTTLRASKRMIAKDYFEGRGGPPCATIVAWRYVYDRVGSFKTEQLAGSDGDWNFRALVLNMKWGHIDEPLYVQRRHPNQLSQSMRRMQRAVHEKAREKYYEMFRNRPRET